MPLTPSFVGSNPATPATDTIYCIRNVHPNTIYGFCFIWLFSLFPKLGKEMGKLFGLNFVFRPVFLSVLPAIAGFFVMFSLLQKCGLGKDLSVNDLLRLFELKFLRVVRVNGGSDRAAQTVPRPDADDLAQNTCLFASAYKGMPQLMGVAFGQQPFHARGDGVEVGLLRFLKVDIGQHLFQHRREGYLAKDDVLPQPLFARFALQPLIVDDLDAFEFGLA